MKDPSEGDLRDVEEVPVVVVAGAKIGQRSDEPLGVQRVHGDPLSKGGEVLGRLGLELVQVVPEGLERLHDGPLGEDGEVLGILGLVHVQGVQESLEQLAGDHNQQNLIFFTRSIALKYFP